jgi:uroporphyrinogen-III synthase
VSRVGITSDCFDDIAPCYVDAGLVPVALPCIRIQMAPPSVMADARREAANADLLVVTSPGVVSLLWPDGRMPPVRTAAVGPSTASNIERAGGAVAIVGDAGLARLVDLLADRVAGRRVLIAHAEGSDPEAMRRLRNLVPELEEHLVYRTVPLAPGADSVDAVSFASPSAVTGWALSRGFDDLVVGAIGDTTAAAVARYRVADVIADRPSHLALAGAIASFMEVNV